MRFIASIQEKTNGQEFTSTILMTAGSMDEARELLNVTASTWYCYDENGDEDVVADDRGVYHFNDDCNAVSAGESLIISELAYQELKQSHLTEFVQHQRREAL